MTKWLYPYLYVTDDGFLNWCTILLNIKFYSKKRKEEKKKNIKFGAAKQTPFIP